MLESGGRSMDVRIEKADDVAVLIPVGNLVASEIDSFNAHIGKLLDTHSGDLLLDMSRISFMDSSGLDAVMALNRFATAGGGVFVCASLPDNLLKVFRVTRADQKIRLAATGLEGLMMIKAQRGEQS